jgi:rare lipoprotein A
MNARKKNAYLKSGHMMKRKIPGIASAATIACLLSTSCGNKKVVALPPAPVPQQRPAAPSGSSSGSPSARRATPKAPPLPVGYSEEGIASWYGIPYHGRQAADGEIYNMETLVAAHKLMPFNTWLRVTNLSNGKVVVVRIIDRGPFVDGRIIDLSKAAARQIDLLGPGITRVRLEVISAPADVPANDFYAVQVAAFSVYDSAEHARQVYAEKYGTAQLAKKVGSVTMWRVLVGKEPSVEAARQIANVLSADNPDVFIVRLDETVVPPAPVPPPVALQAVPQSAPDVRRQ